MRSVTCLIPLTVALVACAPDPSTPKGPSPADPRPGPAGQAPASGESRGAREQAQGGLLDHVQVGQRYTFHLAQSGNEMDMVWEVSEITSAEVKYQVSTLKNGTVLSPPSPSSWPVPSPPPEGTHEHSKAEEPKITSKLEVSRETISIAGRAWDCQLTESDGVRTWVPMHGDLATFPPLLKQSKGAVVSTLLTQIEGP